MFWKILSGVFFCKNFTLVRKCKIRWYALSMYKLIWNELFSKIKYRFSQGIKCMEFIEAHAKFYKIVWCCLEGRLWLIYHLFLFIGKLENQMQKLRATMKKEALFYDFWWHFWPKKLVPFNHCALTWQYWWQKSHERSSSRRTLLYFTCYYYILWIWSWKNSRYFPYFVFKRFSINNGCCLDPLQITDLYNNLSISVRVCVQTLSPPPVLVRFEL